MRCALFVPLLALALACPPAKPPELPPSQPEPAISATVTAYPAPVGLIFDGENIGQTPAQIKVHSIDQLTEALSVSGNPDGAVEQRISIINENEVEVTLLFGHEHTKIAQALGLNKILVFDYGEGITFDTDKSEIRPDFKPLLQKQANMLNTYFSGIDVHICGHTDSRGTLRRNMELSLERAQVVFTELAEAGVPRTSMKMQGFGSDYPLVSNDTEEGRARNRRIEIILGR